jgi:hypothetical protein
VDDEPSLGSVDPSMGGGDQTRWAAGGLETSSRTPPRAALAIVTGSWSKSGTKTGSRR